VKQHVEPFPKEASCNWKMISDITFIDLWGPAHTTAISSYKYFITFTDGKSRYTIVYFIKDKTDDTILKAARHYHALIETQQNRRLKRIRADNGKEFDNEELHNWCQENGIQLEFTAPYSHEQVGVAEHLNRTLVELARAMLIQNSIPHSFWAEAVAYACYIKNRAPSRALKELTTP